MEPTTGAPDAPVVEGSQPPVGTVEAPAATTETGEASPPVESISLDEARKLRREAQELRKRLKAMDEAEQARAEAELSEQQKRERRLAELEQERATWEQERKAVYLTSAVNALSSRLGLVDADAVTRLIDTSAVEYDEAGHPTNVEELVRALLRSKPYLAGRPQPPVATGATEGTTSAPAPALTAAELEQARLTGMSPERYAALKGVKTVDEWLATRRPTS